MDGVDTSPITSLEKPKSKFKKVPSKPKIIDSSSSSSLEIENQINNLTEKK